MSEQPYKWLGESDSPDLRSELTSLLNKYSRENASNTPDFILQEYMMDALRAFELGIERRDEWYGISPSPSEVTDE